MSTNLKIIWVDDSDTIIKEFVMIKPKLFKEVKAFTEKKIHKNVFIFKNLKKNQTEIKTQKDYESLKNNNVLYVRKIENKLLTESIFTRNFNKLPESKQDIISEKYTCSICLELIKNENPLFCYVCQKIFHHKCLDNWEKQLKAKNKKLSCPNCRNELPLKQWKEKLDFKETRENDANIMSQMNKEALSPNQYIIQSNELFKKIFIQFKEINSLMNSNEDKKINEFINRLKNNISTPSLDDVDIEIMDQLEKIKNYIKIKQENNNNNNNNINNIEYKKEINLEYVTDEEEVCDIFGELFVENNMNNIELIINGKQNKLVNKYPLIKGKNNIKMIIKNNLTNLEGMFYCCKTLLNINDLKYLDLKNVTNIKNLFYKCESLQDIQALENWDVSKVENLYGLFCSCKSLSDLNPLKNWNVSNCKNFSLLFNSCESLKDLNGLNNWIFSNALDMSHMFRYCKKLQDISALQNWNVSKCKTFGDMFGGCYWLTDINALKNWNVSNSEDFGGMFYECYYLKDLSPLKNWNVSNSLSFEHMFGHLIELVDLSPLQNWKVGKSKQFNSLFYGCKKLSDLNPIKNWNVSKVSNFYAMFMDCESLSDISPLFNWTFKDSWVDCAKMFNGCSPRLDKASFKNLKFNYELCFEVLD